MKKIIFALLILSACQKEQNAGHLCPFELCPYTGRQSFDGVINTGETAIDTTLTGTDIFYIDKLHFEHPRANYDDLEDMLFCSNAGNQ